MESGTAAYAFDDLNTQGENMFRPDEWPVRGVAVLDGRVGEHDGEQQAVDIHGDVSFAAVCFFSRRPTRDWTEPG